METVSDLPKALAAVATAIGEGTLTPDEASSIAMVSGIAADGYRGLIDVGEVKLRSSRPRHSTGARQFSSCQLRHLSCEAAA
jgi:hypothetical protein